MLSYESDQRPELAPSKQEQRRQSAFARDVKDEKGESEQGRMEKREGNTPFSAGKIFFRVEKRDRLQIGNRPYGKEQICG